MIRHHTNSQEQEVFTGRVQDLQAASAWARCIMHLLYGEELGERMYRQLPARRVLSLWAWAGQQGDA